MSELRRACFREAATRLGIGQDFLTISDQTVDPPDQGAWITRHRQELGELQLPDRCTAVMCYNDLIALALQSILMERGIRVPQDISVIGFDDLQAEYGMPGLTTVSHALSDSGRACVSLAIDLVEERLERNPAPEIRVPSRLVLRLSTAAAHL